MLRSFRKLSFFIAAVAAMAPSISSANQFGFMIGGGVDVRSSIDTIALIPYFNSGDIAGNSKLRYHIPVAFSFDQEGSAAPDVFGISVIPSIEYDLISESKFGVSTTIGVALGYNTIEATGGNIDQFAVGVVPSLHLKYAVSDKVILRFVPASLNVSPWSYTSDGVGSETEVAIAYQIQGGIGYNF